MVLSDKLTILESIRPLFIFWTEYGTSTQELVVGRDVRVAKTGKMTLFLENFSFDDNGAIDYDLTLFINIEGN